MGQLKKSYKVVAALPGVLEPNSVYFVRVGAGFDLYTTNSTGVIVAYPLNQTATPPPMAAARIPVGTDVNVNAVLALTQTRADLGWVLAGNAWTYTGTPDRVRIAVQVPQTIPQNVSRQRPAPALELYRNGALLSSSQTGYIRDATDHEESSNSISIVDGNPGPNPAYELRGRRESSNTGPVTAMTGAWFTLEAVL